MDRHLTLKKESSKLIKLQNSTKIYKFKKNKKNKENRKNRENRENRKMMRNKLFNMLSKSPESTNKQIRMKEKKIR